MDCLTSKAAPLLINSPGSAPFTVFSALAHLSLRDLEAQLASWGFKASHAARLQRDYLQARQQAAQLPHGLQEKLRQLDSGTRLAMRQCAADGTTKLLVAFKDGHAVESVLMPDYRPDRAAGCISSQAGCAMGCDFCATAKSGFERNLTTGEILEQFVALRHEARLQGRKLQTLVFMGMGEPLLNLEAVLPAVEAIAANPRGALGWRQVTISTVGIIPGIDALTATGLGFQLALSLHAPDDATRARLLPAAKRFPIADILEAADRFQAARGRYVSLQYCLLKDINDSPEHARMLAALLAKRRMHVNLLQYNPTGPGLRGTIYEPSPEGRASVFAQVLQQSGMVAHFRRSRGPDIDAACGQLRRVEAGRNPHHSFSGQ